MKLKLISALCIVLTIPMLSGCAPKSAPFAQAWQGEWSCVPANDDGLDSTGNPRTWEAVIDESTIELKETLDGQEWFVFWDYQATSDGFTSSLKGHVSQNSEGRSDLIAPDEPMTSRVSVGGDISPNTPFTAHTVAEPGGVEISYDFEPLGNKYQITEVGTEDSYFCKRM